MSGVGIGTTANGFSLHATGPINFIGTCYASSFAGDGSQITNLNVVQTGWAPVTEGGIYNTNLNNVGIGTTAPRFNLELGSDWIRRYYPYTLMVSPNLLDLLRQMILLVGGALTVTGAFNFA